MLMHYLLKEERLQISGEAWSAATRLAACAPMARRLLLALISAMLLTLSFPRFSVSLLAWIALVPLLLSLRGLSVGQAFGLGFLAGLAFNSGIFYWLVTPQNVMLMDFALIMAYLALYGGAFGAAVAMVSRQSSIPPFLAVPTIWVALEYLRSHFFFLEFPWASLGHSQYESLALIQVAAVTGAYGISFLIVLANVAVLEVLQKRSLAVSSVTATLILIGLAVAGGSYTLLMGRTSLSLPVTVVQGNIPQDVRWDPAFRKEALARHLDLTRRAVRDAPSSLVIWPETSVPGAFVANDVLDLQFRQELAGVAKDTGAYLLVGSAERPKFSRVEVAQNKKNRFNTASLMAPAGRVVQTYHKMKLVPFGEYLPYQGSFLWPSRYVEQAGNYVAGEEQTIFRLPGRDGHSDTFGVLICWETIFPDFVRRFANRGAMFFVVMANEAYFADTPATEQFVAMSVFRAVENRRSVVRSVNAGISGMIDPYGRILALMDADGPERSAGGYLTQRIPLLTDFTFYTLYGDVFAKAVAAAACLLLLLALRQPCRILVRRECR